MPFFNCAVIESAEETNGGTLLVVYLSKSLAKGDSLIISGSPEKSFTVSEIYTIPDHEPITEAEEGITVTLLLRAPLSSFREGLTLRKKMEETVPAGGGLCIGRRRP